MNNNPHLYPKPPARTRVYFDAEFTGLHRNTTLISIGLYCKELDASFYAEFNDFDKEQVNPWIQSNVVNSLILQKEHDKWINAVGIPGQPFSTLSTIGSKEHVSDLLKNWLKNIHIHTGNKIQFYTDCYAYDWMLMNDLICVDGKALNLPDYIDYIPIDLSTYFQIAGIDPDITREDYLGKAVIDTIKDAPLLKPFTFKGAMKHNSLWDAIIASLCFFKLDTRFLEPPIDFNRRVWDPVMMQANTIAIDNDSRYLLINRSLPDDSKEE